MVSAVGRRNFEKPQLAQPRFRVSARFSDFVVTIRVSELWKVIAIKCTAHCMSLTNFHSLIINFANLHLSLYTLDMFAHTIMIKKIFDNSEPLVSIDQPR